MSRQLTDQVLASAAAKETNGYLEVEETVKQNDTIVYVREERDNEDWPIQEAFLQAITDKKSRAEIVNDLISITVDTEKNVYLKLKTPIEASRWLNEIPSITVQSVRYRGKIAEALTLVRRPNVMKVRIWGIPSAIKDSDILKKLNQYGTPVQYVKHEYCRNFKTIENGNRYVYMTYFKTRFGTPRYIYIHGIKCRTTHEGQERPPPGTRFDRNGYEIQQAPQEQKRTTSRPEERREVRPEERPEEDNAWATDMLKEHTDNDGDDEEEESQRSDIDSDSDGQQPLVVDENISDTMKPTDESPPDQTSNGEPTEFRNTTYNTAAPTELEPTDIPTQITADVIPPEQGSTGLSPTTSTPAEPERTTRPQQSFADVTKVTTKASKVMNIPPKFQRDKPISTRARSTKPGPPTRTEPRDGSAKRLRTSPLDLDSDNPPQRKPPRTHVQV